jgi:RND family efflux transporter MFP subunit
MLTFPRPGAWDLSVTVPDAGGDATIQLGRVEVFADAHEAAHAEAPVAPEGVTFLKDQQWKLRLQTRIVGQRRLIERVTLPAKARAKPGYRASVLAPLAGQLLAPPGGVVPLPGERVEAGQVLAVVQPLFSDAAERVAEIEAEFTGAQAALRQAETAFERIQKLAAQQARSARELQEAEVALATARSRYDAASALQSTYRRHGPPAQTNRTGLPALELRAPIAGVVNALGAGPGEPVKAGDTVFGLLNPEVLWIEARVPELTWERLAAAQGAAFELPSARGQFTDILAKGGRLVFTGLEVDVVTRTLPLIYEVDNRDGRLRVGQTLTLHVETTHLEDAIAVPESALLEDGGRPVAFVQVAGETFEKRELVLGIRDAEWVQVLAGLQAGERVVTQGAFAVRLASVSSTIPAHGHAH